MTRLRSQITGRVWLLALVPYVALALTAALPHAHNLCSQGPEHGGLGGATASAVASLGGLPASEAPCPLCQWQATGKLPGEARPHTDVSGLLPVDAVALLPVCVVASPRADVRAARAPPAVPA